VDNLATNETQFAPSPLSETENLIETQTWKEKVVLLIDHNISTIVMTIITIYALFGDDIRMLAFEKKDDDVFYSLSVISLFAFLLELVLSSIAKPDYLNSFYFWLDLVATVSLVPDIGWIWNPMIGQEEDSGGSNDAEQV
jgi:hypothetical protein